MADANAHPFADTDNRPKTVEEVKTKKKPAPKKAEPSGKKVGKFRITKR